MPIIVSRVAPGTSVRINHTHCYWDTEKSIDEYFFFFLLTPAHVVYFLSVLFLLTGWSVCAPAERGWSGGYDKQPWCFWAHAWPGGYVHQVQLWKPLRGAHPAGQAQRWDINIGTLFFKNWSSFTVVVTVCMRAHAFLFIYTRVCIHSRSTTCSCSYLNQPITWQRCNTHIKNVISGCWFSTVEWLLVPDELLISLDFLSYWLYTQIKSCLRQVEPSVHLKAEGTAWPESQRNVSSILWIHDMKRLFWEQR